MLTLFHSPNSRSSAVVMLLNEMGITDKVEVRHVSIKRIDGSGEVDPTNPHPEGKVPALLHDGHLITERWCDHAAFDHAFPGNGACAACRLAAVG
ncbi:hypothetical protein [Cypionkella sp.]|uniref:hypothetical protein n=1 Tax=Cypionkella sp. TaxID=2811411 RepID=UPI002A0FD645|nr:glutathione S-transferase family protein [Cypionkella sp.]